MVDPSPDGANPSQQPTGERLAGEILSSEGPLANIPDAAAPALVPDFDDVVDTMTSERFY